MKISKMNQSDSNLNPSDFHSLASFHSTSSRSLKFNETNPLNIRIEFSKDQSKLSIPNQEQGQLQKNDQPPFVDQNESSLVSNSKFKLNSESLNHNSLLVDGLTLCNDSENYGLFEEPNYKSQQGKKETNVNQISFNLDLNSQVHGSDPQNDQPNASIILFDNENSKTRFGQKQQLLNGIGMCLKTLKVNKEQLSKTTDLNQEIYKQLIEDSRSRLAILRNALPFRNFLARSENQVNVISTKRK